MNKFLSAVLLVLFTLVCMERKATAQNREEFDNLVFFVPQGFSVTKSTNSVLLTDGTLGTGESFTISISRSTLSFRKIEKTFPLFWKESLVMDGFDNPAAEPQFTKFTNSGGWDCFRGGKMVSYSAQSPPQYYHLTVIKYVGVTNRIITRASSEDLFQRKIPLLMQLVSSIEFKKQPPPQNGNTGIQNNPSSGNSGTSNTGNTNKDVANTSVPVRNYVLYMSVQGDLMSDAEISVMYFSPDGTVYTDIPPNGFAQFNIQEQKTKTPESFGTYRSSGNSIVVKMNGAATETTYQIGPDGSLQPSTNPALVFKKIEPLDNYRLEDSYIKKQENNGVKISFGKDGRFTENGLVKNITPNLSDTNNPGSGTYSISQNSLQLHYDDGHTLSISIYIMPEDYQMGDKIPKILVNNYVLTRL